MITLSVFTHIILVKFGSILVKTKMSMWKYIVVYWVVVIGTDKIQRTKNTQEFTVRKEAIDFIEFSKRQNVLLITDIKLDSIKVVN